MRSERPETAQQLASAMREAAGRGQPIALDGGNSKARMGARVDAPSTAITTTALNRVLQYDPADLTISVEAGLPFAELCRVVGERGQILPLDPPFFDSATVGGVVAANSSGPRRRQYGTARDVIIGMTYATLEGKLIDTGGRVVKNVAGLDIAKLMTGSFGTLAAIAKVNFHVFPAPVETRLFHASFKDDASMMAVRDRVLRGVLQPSAVDAVNPAAAKRLGLEGYALLIGAGGSAAVLGRYQRELAECAVMDGALWNGVREFVPAFLAEREQAVVARVSVLLSEVGAVLASTQAPALARAASGVVYICFASKNEYAAWSAEALPRNWPHVVEYAPAKGLSAEQWWPTPGADFPTMEKVKALFDPKCLLNRGRLHGRI